MRADLTRYSEYRYITWSAPITNDFTDILLSYLISKNVIFLTIAEKNYPRKLAFSFLDELSKEFHSSYGPKVDTVRKPYAFVGFGESFLHPTLAPEMASSDDGHGTNAKGTSAL